jgi:hypothetical protein
VSNNQQFRPPLWLRLWNKVFIQLTRLGISFGADGPVVMTVPGRKFGKPRSTPVTPMTVDGNRYVTGSRILIGRKTSAPVHRLSPGADLMEFNNLE